MSKIFNITDAELEVMKIIWRKSKTTANIICEELEDKVTWKISTIKTLLGRLCGKGAIAFEKVGKEYFYYPLFSQEEYSTMESQSFLEKIYNGSMNLMLLNFVKSKNLSKSDVDELKRILNKVESKEV